MKKILLIEDNKDIRENTAEILKLAQYNVITAKNGKEGVELTLKERPDLIICDIMMPVLDVSSFLESKCRTPCPSSTGIIISQMMRSGFSSRASSTPTLPFSAVLTL